jgi:hypothetical protein
MFALWNESQHKGIVFMPMFGSRQPTRVTVDPSCNGLPAAWDPQVQAMALKLLRLSAPTDQLPPNEWGIMASEPYIGEGAWIGGPFTEHQSHEISLDRIMRERPSPLENMLTGYRPNSVFLHTHPNPGDPGAVSADDRALGIPVIAVDTKGRLTCAY